MRWITRSHVHVDRVACPWLIKRFIDSEAEFLFVPAGKVAETAAVAGAIPFDAPGAEFGHRGEACSFEALVEDHGLTDPGLLLLADIVGGADTGRPGAHPVSAGLEALATGYSLRHPDDAENLARQFELYDSLYAWCRLEAARSRDAGG